MNVSWSWRSHLELGRFLLRWLLISGPAGALIGSACALFIWSLEIVTNLRFANPWLLFLLPVAGLAMGWAYHTIGKSVESGNNLIVEEIHEPRAGIPKRMAPLILISTLVTHLFGGSAGREGTAVQLGGSIASFFGRILKLDNRAARTLLLAGVAGGFGGVFGTPLAGAIFALEVLTIGRMEYEALVPCLITSVVSDIVCRSWGIQHAAYQHASSMLSGLRLEWVLLGKVAIASLAFGLVSVLFVEAIHGVSLGSKKLIRSPLLRPILGALIVIGLVLVLGTRDYLGLGDISPDPHSTTITSAFQHGGAAPLAWLWKTIFTAFTLGSGFKGGEVTPLFFVGATLGNVLSTILSAPPELFAALGFVAVFAGATNTPLACTIMGVELFGSDNLIFFAVACFFSYFISGRSSLYPAQRVLAPKTVRIDE